MKEFLVNFKAYSHIHKYTNLVCNMKEIVCAGGICPLVKKQTAKDSPVVHFPELKRMKIKLTLTVKHMLCITENISGENTPIFAKF